MGKHASNTPSSERRGVHRRNLSTTSSLSSPSLSLHGRTMHSPSQSGPAALRQSQSQSQTGRDYSGFGSGNSPPSSSRLPLTSSPNHGDGTSSTLPASQWNLITRLRRSCKTDSLRGLALVGLGVALVILVLVVLITSFVPASKKSGNGALRTTLPANTFIVPRNSNTPPTSIAASSETTPESSLPAVLWEVTAPELDAPALPLNLLTLPPHRPLRDGELSFSDIRTTPEIYGIQVRATYDHDAQAFTQGLSPAELTADRKKVKTLYESTGLYGRSVIKEVDLVSGRTLRRIGLPRTHFGEGLTVVGDLIYVLTWHEGVIHVLNRTDFRPVRTRQLPPEISQGWGLTFDENTNHLVISDGSSTLYWIDPQADRLSVARKLKVRVSQVTPNVRRDESLRVKPLQAAAETSIPSAPGLLSRLGNAIRNALGRFQGNGNTSTPATNDSDATASPTHRIDDMGSSAATPESTPVVVDSSASATTNAEVATPTTTTPPSTPDAIAASSSSGSVPPSILPGEDEFVRVPVSEDDIRRYTREVTNINELEWVEGRILANIWFSDEIAIVNPRSGMVEGWIHTQGIRPRSTLDDSNSVLNGIAYSSVTKQLFVTGKQWPKLYDIMLRSHN